MKQQSNSTTNPENVNRLDEVLNELKQIIDSPDLTEEEIDQVETFVKENFNNDGSLAMDLEKMLND